ncbi:hypothetical protein GCK72_017195 [Caenorhabditis remanei]|uniref:CX domain-containing protein n=1 Tax=Caenorhabditis remanei TaxID=31234 RepID=E3N534_CAERE|nr:hypothetical protein GCK72_017195 [Caenorhabditis remanei]EFO86996.1 hypothetical protein CRE_19345 [Caenorhabditis remanei]KAF1750644.1 hypothetical protein GCK72_017195 [Caenorhabditis remanei]
MYTYLPYFLVILDGCFARRSHKVRYDTTDFRAYLFGSSDIWSKYFEPGAAFHSYTIKEPSTPVQFDNLNYYWHGFYEKTSETTKKICKYGITEADGELQNVRFENGTSPKAISFGCSKWDECCGFKCCNNIQGFLVMMGCIAFMFLVVLGVFYFG